MLRALLPSMNNLLGNRRRVGRTKYPTRELGLNPSSSDKVLSYRPDEHIHVCGIRLHSGNNLQ